VVDAGVTGVGSPSGPNVVDTDVTGVGSPSGPNVVDTDVTGVGSPSGPNVVDAADVAAVSSPFGPTVGAVLTTLVGAGGMDEADVIGVEADAAVDAEASEPDVDV